MAWFSGKVSLGNFPDFSEAVNKLSESVKNIGENLDTALGLEEKSDDAPTTSEAPGLWPSATDRKTLFEPIMGFMGQKAEDGSESPDESEEQPNLSESTSTIKDIEADTDSSANHASEQAAPRDEPKKEIKLEDGEAESEGDMKDSAVKQKDAAPGEYAEAEVVTPATAVEISEQVTEEAENTNSLQKDRSAEELPSPEQSVETDLSSHPSHVEVISFSHELDDSTSARENVSNQHGQGEVAVEVFPAEADDGVKNPAETGVLSGSVSDSPLKTDDAKDNSSDDMPIVQHHDMKALEVVDDSISVQKDMIAKSIDQEQTSNEDSSAKERPSIGSNSSDIAGSAAELERVKNEMRMMETALQGAAKQAQAKADEIAKLMNENEHLKAAIDDIRSKTNEETESLREEYHQRVAVLERKVYALTKERDTLRREHNKKSDAAALLKEKDEIITQVMAEGEELSKKQATQEGQIRKLRAQIRELEEEKKGLFTKLQAEENKVESIKRDKTATEQLLQESVELHQAELAAQKEYYTDALNAAKEAEALAEARANTEARTELEIRLREAGDRESMLVQTLEELRETLSRKEQQAVYREEMLRRDVEDLQKRYQASERRCEELITQVPESTRPLLRQIEGMQETAARKAEAWAAVERSLNSRLQEAEAKAAGAEEKERSINERLTQTLSRINVLEAQISCLRTEQTQLTRSLEKERQKASESRQEYLALKEESDTHEGRVRQLEEEIKELRKKHEDLHEVLTHQELLQQELERERTARMDQERAARLQPSAIPDQSTIMRQKSTTFENGNLICKLSSQSSLSSMEESFFLQSTLDSSDNFSEHRSAAEGTMSPYYLKSMTSSTFEAALRQKDGELASYISRLASMESIRDSLAEELVKMTAQCEKLRTEAATLPGIRAELEALRRRHTAALELMGERDEELEELRADIVDLKEMYREQVNLLVNKIQTIGVAR